MNESQNQSAQGFVGDSPDDLANDPRLAGAFTDDQERCDDNDLIRHQRQGYQG